MFSKQIIMNPRTQEIYVSDVIKCTHNGREEYRAGNEVVRKMYGDEETWVIAGDKSTSDKPMRNINQHSTKDEREYGWVKEECMNDYDTIRMLHNRALVKDMDKPVDKFPYTTGQVWNREHTRPTFMNIIDNGNGTFVAYKPNSAKLNIVISYGGEWRLAS